MREYLSFLRHTVLWVLVMVACLVALGWCLRAGAIQAMFIRGAYGEYVDYPNYLAAGLWVGGGLVALAGMLSAGWAWRRERRV